MPQSERALARIGPDLPSSNPLASSASSGPWGMVGGKELMFSKITDSPSAISTRAVAKTSRSSSSPEIRAIALSPFR